VDTGTRDIRGDITSLHTGRRNDMSTWAVVLVNVHLFLFEHTMIRAWTHLVICDR